MEAGKDTGFNAQPQRVTSGTEQGRTLVLMPSQPQRVTSGKEHGKQEHRVQNISFDGHSQISYLKVQKKKKKKTFIFSCTDEILFTVGKI